MPRRLLSRLTLACALTLVATGSGPDGDGDGDGDRGAAAVSAEAPTPTEVPAHNRADLEEAPPRPPVGSADERARHLFEAIVADDPELGMDFFFPRGPFRLVKDSSNPDRYYDRLLAAYRREIHALHESLRDLDRAQYERFEVSERARWQAPGSEYNLLPYWSARRNTLHYTVDGEARSIRVLVVITWDDEWYVAHLTDYL